MSEDTPINLDEEMTDIFNREEMLAFFDFQLTTSTNRTFSGLCKISDPKEHEDRSTYYSLLFLTDVPEEKSWQEVDDLMAKLDWDQFRRYLPHVESVMPLPFHRPAGGVHVSETYVYVTAPKTPPDIYVRHELYPAILRVTGFKAGELVMWGEMTESAGAPGAEPTDAHRGASGDKPLPPSLERLKNLLK